LFALLKCSVVRTFNLIPFAQLYCSGNHCHRVSQKRWNVACRCRRVIFVFNITRQDIATHCITGRYYAASSATHPVGRCGTPRDVAQLVLFLSDPSKSGFCTGSVYPCDGGRLLPVPLAPQWQKN
jgi:hypothetical protein